MNSGAHAETAHKNWKFELPVLLTAGTYTQDTPRSTYSHNALSAFVEFRLRSTHHPLSIGLFVDRRISPDNRIPDMLKTGTILRHQRNNWDTLVAIFRSRPFGRPSSWGYAGRVRYRFGDGHKFGIESFGKHKQFEASYVMFGYYGAISRVVSFQLVAGSNVSSSRDRAARMEIIWQIN